MWCDVTWHIVGPDVVSDYCFTSYGIAARSVTAVCRYFARMFLTVSLLDIDNGKVSCCMKRAVSDSSVTSRNAVLHVVFRTESSSFYLFKEVIVLYCIVLYVLNLRQTTVWQYCGNNVNWRIILAVDGAATVSILIYFFSVYIQTQTLLQMWPACLHQHPAV